KSEGLMSNPAAGPARRSWVAAPWRVVNSRVRHQIVIPYLLLAIIFALAGTYILTSSISRSLHDRFDRQLLSTAQERAQALQQAEEKQLAGLRTLLYTQGVPGALLEARYQHTPAALRTLRELLAPAASNAGFEQVLVVATDTV